MLIALGVIALPISAITRISEKRLPRPFFRAESHPDEDFRREPFDSLVDGIALDLAVHQYPLAG